MKWCCLDAAGGQLDLVFLCFCPATKLRAMETQLRPVATLTKHEEAALARRIEAGLAAKAVQRGELRVPEGATQTELERIATDGQEAFDELISCNFSLVGYVVNPIARATGLDREELTQERFVGLLEAAWRFDPARAGFATCALPWIRMRAWDDAVTAHGTLGLPARRARRWRRAVAAHTELAERLDRRPTTEEVADEAGESEGVVRSLLMFQPVRRLTDEQAGALAVPVAVASNDADLSGLLRALPSVQRAILALRHGIGGEAAMSTPQIAERLRISPSSVRRYEQSALAALRASTVGPLAA